MTDIQTKTDIKTLVDTFYAKVNIDPVLGSIFNKRAKVDWDEHIPKLYDFWSSVLLQTGEYKGQPFFAHLKLGQLHLSEFDHWLNLFVETVDELFMGAMATQAKKSAQNIANVLMMKLGVTENEFLNTIE